MIRGIAQTPRMSLRFLLQGFLALSHGECSSDESEPYPIFVRLAISRCAELRDREDGEWDIYEAGIFPPFYHLHFLIIVIELLRIQSRQTFRTTNKITFNFQNLKSKTTTATSTKITKMQFSTVLLTIFTTFATVAYSAPVAAPFPLPSPLERPNESCHALDSYGSSDECNASCGKDSFIGS